MWLDMASGVTRRSDDLTSMHQAMSMLKEAEANPTHRLHTILDVYRRHKVITRLQRRVFWDILGRP